MLDAYGEFKDMWKLMNQGPHIVELAPTKVGMPSGTLVQIGITDTPKQKSIMEAVLEMAEREAKEIAQLRAQVLTSPRML
jgi:hypothetical protein